MKLSRITWYVLGTGIIIIGVVSLYMLYTQEEGERKELETALATTQDVLPGLAEERATLESKLTENEDKLAQAESQLSANGEKFPVLVESIELDEQLFLLADEWGLEITELVASEPHYKNIKVEAGDEIKVEDVIFFTTSFTVDVKGEVTDILEYINAIVTHHDFNTATVELAGIEIPEPLREEEKDELTEEEILEREMPSASIKLVIYGYEGE
jgi:hypothetical protein